MDKLRLIKGVGTNCYQLHRPYATGVSPVLISVYPMS